MAPEGHRFARAAVLGLCCAATLSACSGGGTEVRSDSQATVRIHDVSFKSDAPRCNRLQDYLTLEVPVREGQVTAILDIGGVHPVAEAVKIRVDTLFRGDAWRDGVGRLDVNSQHGRHVITGSAYGVYAARPDELGATAAFSVDVTC